MSVRLTLRLRPEQECIVDCSSQSAHGVHITLELADNVSGADDGPILHRDGSTVGEDKAEDAAVMANAGYSVEGQEGCAVVRGNRYSGQSGLLGHGQISQNGLNRS